MDRSSTRAASSPSPTRALSAPSTTRRYFPPGRRISSCRPRRADLGTKFAARTISPQTSFPRASSAREFSSNKSSISSSSRKKKAAFHYSRYYFWTTRVRRERERERERIRVSQLVVSRFPSRDLRAQNRCVLKRSARRRRSKIIDTRARAKITFPFERVVLPFGRAFSSLYTLHKSRLTPHKWDPKREGVKALHPSRALHKTGKKKRAIQTTEKREILSRRKKRIFSPSC